MFEIRNRCLTVRAAARGAELQSIRGAGGTEYLWQGDPAYWEDRAPNIFPYVARLTEGRYTLGGRSYSLPIHGFAPTSIFSCRQCAEDRMCFTLESTPELLTTYPFPFRFSITYALEDDRLHVTSTVENRGDGTMYFGLGGHPGIRVPLEKGLDFTDYVLEFPPDSAPWREIFSPDCFPTGERLPFPLRDHVLPLEHGLFDDDAIVLSHAPSQVTLRAPGGRHGVTLFTGGLPYLGLWHRPHTDAPYVCLEPWSSLPSRKGIVEDLAAQPDLLSLPAGEAFETTWSLRCF